MLIVALSESVTNSLKEAEQSLRNALAFSARQEKPFVCKEIAKMIQQIETLKNADEVLDMLENRKEGGSGMFGNFFG
jgi:hypothetical protein